MVSESRADREICDFLERPGKQVEITPFDLARTRAERIDPRDFNFE